MELLGIDNLDDIYSLLNGEVDTIIVLQFHDEESGLVNTINATQRTVCKSSVTRDFCICYGSKQVGAYSDWLYISGYFLPNNNGEEGSGQLNVSIDYSLNNIIK